MLTKTFSQRRLRCANLQIYWTATILFIWLLFPTSFTLAIQSPVPGGGQEQTHPGFHSEAFAKTDLNPTAPAAHSKGKVLGFFRSFVKEQVNPRPPRNKRATLPGENQATLAFILGLVGMILFPPLGIVGFVLGLSSLSKYRKGLHDQRVFAILGIVFGAISILYTGLILLLILSAW